MVSAFLLLSAAWTPALASEEGDDAGSWASVQINKSLGKAYAVARFEHRSFQSFSATEAWFTVAGAGYKLAPWLKSDLTYEYWHVSPDISIHKAVLCANASASEGPLSVALREKLEYVIGGSCTLRSRLRVQYANASWTVRPYAMSEIFTWDSWIRSLYYAGVDVKLSAHSSLDFFYLYHVPAGKVSEHVLGVGYVLNL